MCKKTEAHFSTHSLAGEDMMPGTATALLQSRKDVNPRTKANMQRMAKQKDRNNRGISLG